MGKLGGKARKFAKKNLQSVLKRKRKLKAVFKKRDSKRGGHGGVGEEDGEDRVAASRKLKVEDVKDIDLDGMFGEDESDFGEDDDLDSDGYLSEDESLSHPGEKETENSLDDNNDALSMQSRELHLELSKKRKKLDRLKEKDKNFSKFLESNRKRLRTSQNDDDHYSDDDYARDDRTQFVNGYIERLVIGKLLSSSSVDSYYQLVMEQHNVPALVSLLNSYRAACLYGTESSNHLASSESCSKISMLMLGEANNIFQKILGISSNKKEAILNLKNSAKWQSLKPSVKSYLRSTLYLLNEVSDSEILAFALRRLRDSITFFAPFPSLLQKLIKISVHLWATGKGSLSQQSFLVVKDVATVFNSEWFDTCLIKAYKAFISHCKFMDAFLFNHIKFLRNSLVELCSQDVEKSFSTALTSVKQVAKMLQVALLTKKKEAVKLISSWQFTNCIDLWVAYTSVHIRDNEYLQPLLYMIIQVINGVANLFPGPRYLPLRVKCVQWLNHLSTSSRVFIPVASYALDVLEYKVAKGGRKPGKDMNLKTTIKVPKLWLKSRKFQEECVFSAIELLAMHFAQWSYHISFPELATIPLIRLRKVHEINTIESFQRVVKRFIDQVEQNIEFVRKKRDEVSFSPKDQQFAENFLQLEKGSGKTPFMQYYGSLMEKAASRNPLPNEKISFPEQKKQKVNMQKISNNNENLSMTGEV